MANIRIKNNEENRLNEGVTFNPSIGFINTNLFSTEALYYLKNKRYDDGDYGTKYWFDYWKEQKKRCLEGYSVGGVRITGRHYFYLNFAPIERVVKKILKGKTVKDRSTGFPDFWDEDYNLYHLKEIARYGIDFYRDNEKTYKLNDEQLVKSLNLDFEINPNHLSGNKHIIWLKPRGVGASFKAGAEGAYNYFMVNKSKTYYLASTIEYLMKDGVISKFLDVRNFITSYNWNSDLQIGGHGFYQNTLVHDKEKMVFKNGRLASDGKTEVGGKLSEVYGVNLNGDPDKARGKRGIQIHFEEFGNFKDADKAWTIARPSVEEGDIMYGQIIGYGTGGTEGAGFAAMEKMFYDPDPYNAIAVNNKWDEGAEGTFVSYFTPAYKDIGFVDENGNSLQTKAKAFYDKEREAASKSSDGALILRKKAEKPYNPREATLVTSGNPFLRGELVTHLNNVLALKARNGVKSLGITVDLFTNGTGGIDHKYDNALNPIDSYPFVFNKEITKVQKKLAHGCVVIYHLPYKDVKTNRVPPNLYYACHDPYKTETGLDSGDKSLGAVYILENNNNLTDTKGDIIMASYIGRPDSQDDFNNNMFKLLKMYNARVGVENNAGGVYDYAKRHQLLGYLEKQFTLGFSEKLATKSTINRAFGMHMTADRKRDGIEYLKDWLYAPRAVDLETGEEILNLHTIKDIGLLQEFVKFNDKGNFDRISALIVGIFYKKELFYQNRKPNNSIISSNIQNLFANLSTGWGNVFE